MSKMTKTSPESSGEIVKGSKNVKKVKKRAFFSKRVKNDHFCHFWSNFRKDSILLKTQKPKKTGFFGGVKKWSFLTRFWNFTLKSDPQRHLKIAPEKSQERGKNWNLGVEKKGSRKKWQKTCFSKIDFWDCRRNYRNLIKNDKKCQKSQKNPKKTGG